MVSATKFSFIHGTYTTCGFLSHKPNTTSNLEGHLCIIIFVGNHITNVDQMKSALMYPVPVACSHNRAWMYYAESVDDPYAFPAVKCTNYVKFTKGLCSGNTIVPMAEPDSPQPMQAYMGIMADSR